MAYNEVVMSYEAFTQWTYCYRMLIRVKDQIADQRSHRNEPILRSRPYALQPAWLPHVRRSVAYLSLMQGGLGDQCSLKLNPDTLRVGIITAGGRRVCEPQRAQDLHIDRIGWTQMNTYQRTEAGFMDPTIGVSMPDVVADAAAVSQDHPNND
jgi:hypothetical protein